MACPSATWRSVLLTSGMRPQTPSWPASHLCTHAHTHEEQGSLPVAALLQTLHLPRPLCLPEPSSFTFTQLSRESRRSAYMAHHRSLNLSLDPWPVGFRGLSDHRLTNLKHALNIQSIGGAAISHARA